MGKKILIFVFIFALMVSANISISINNAQAKAPAEEIDLTTGLPISGKLPHDKSQAVLAPLTKGATGGKILWDKTHGVYLSYEPSGKYSDITTILQSLGYTMTTTTNIGGVTLSNYDVLVVCLGSAWNSAYSTSEKSKIQAYVQGGGGLLIMGENTNCPNANINPIAQAFGVTCGVSEFSTDDLYFNNLASHAIFDGVSTVYYRAAGEVNATSPAEEVAWYGSKATAAVSHYGAGNIVVAGDISFCENANLANSDNQQFAENIFNWLSTAGTAWSKFDFNDGTTQGWTLEGAYIDGGSVPQSNNFTFSWWDQVNHPNIPFTDPWGDNRGSAMMFTSGGHGISNSSFNWWIMQYHSPDLSGSSEWQNATGYTVELSDAMTTGSTLYCNLYVVVYDHDLAADRYFYSGTAQPLQHYSSKSWNHFEFNWTGLPTNRTIKEVFVNIWGTRTGLIEGGLFLDEVTPIGGAGPSWIRVTYPNGGETWTVGNTYNIRWDTDQTVGQVKIEISTTGGSSWWDVTQGHYTPNDKSYPYTVVSQNVSEHCLFRVTSIENPSAKDQSNAEFVITTNEPDIAVTPTSWNYGSVAVGSYSNKTFVVSNTGNATLNVSSVILTGGSSSQFSIRSGGGAFNLALGSTRNVIVRFSPTSAGSKTTSLRFASNDPDENPLNVSLSGNGTQPSEPDIAVNPTSWNYGDIEVGNHPDKTFVVSNTGNATLNVSSVILTGGSSSQFSIRSGGGAFNLAPGSTRNVVVRFSPTDPGAKNTTLRFSSNDPDENPLDVALIGTGGAELPGHWHFKDMTGSSAICILPTTANPNIDGDPLHHGDFIGVFTPAGLCCGHAIWEGANLSITAWGDDDQTVGIIDGFIAGELIKYRVYRSSESKEWATVAVGYSDGTGFYSPNGVMALNQFDVSDLKTITLNLTQGWNMFSMNVNPLDPNVEQVMAPVVAELTIMKNGAGKAYIPSYGINNIGNINFKEGYQAYMTAAATLDVSGQAVAADTPIDLPAGWSIIAYLPDAPIDAAIAFASLGGKLKIAKDNAGRTYIPAYGINTIGEMQPGQGYQIYLTAAGTLVYPAGAALIAANQPDEKHPTGMKSAPVEHFAFTAQTGENAVVVITTDIAPQYSDGTNPESGDEIGVFNSDGLCCGAIVWQECNTALTVWSNNNETEQTDGFQAGGALQFRVWKKSADQEYPIRVKYTEGHPAAYEADGFSVLTEFVAALTSDIAEMGDAALPTDFSLLQNYPNPFNPETTVEYALPKAGWVTLEIYSILGQNIRTLVNQNQAAGIHYQVWDGKNSAGEPVTSGIYFYRLHSGSFSATKKMLLMQ